MYGYTEEIAGARLRDNGIRVETKLSRDGQFISKTIKMTRPVGLRLLGAVDYLKGKGYTIL